MKTSTTDSPKRRKAPPGFVPWANRRAFRQKTLHQTHPSYQNELHLEVSADRITRGGLSDLPVFRDDGQVVGMHYQGSDNTSVSVKVGLLHKFLDGDLPWTACSDYPSVRACIARATRQARDLAEAGDVVAQYQLGRDDGHLDKDEAMLRRAAEGGFVSAQHTWAKYLREREAWKKAAHWFAVAAASRGSRGRRLDLRSRTTGRRECPGNACGPSG